MKDIFKTQIRGVAVHACNPSYSGGGDQEDHSMTSPGKNLARPHFNK
jgi:hypothetical protein